MVVRENRIPLFGTLSGHETKAPAKCGSPPVPLTERHGSSGNQAVESEGTTVHVDGYQVASRAVIQPELHRIAGCRGIAAAVRSVEPPRSGFIVHEAVASFDVEKLDASLHRFAAPPGRACEKHLTYVVESLPELQDCFYLAEPEARALHFPFAGHKENGYGWKSSDHTRVVRL
jgi:hypothetical protein